MTVPQHQRIKDLQAENEALRKEHAHNRTASVGGYLQEG